MNGLNFHLRTKKILRLQIFFSVFKELKTKQKKKWYDPLNPNILNFNIVFFISGSILFMGRVMNPADQAP